MTDSTPSGSSALAAEAEEALAAAEGLLNSRLSASQPASSNPPVTLAPESGSVTSGYSPANKNCAATVARTGEPCRGFHTAGSRFCLFHDPERQKLNRDASARGGRRRAIAAAAEQLNIDLLDQSGIQAAIAQVLRLELLGAVAPRQAASLHGLLRLLVVNARAMGDQRTDPSVFVEASQAFLQMTPEVAERLDQRERIENTRSIGAYAAMKDVDVQTQARLKLAKRGAPNPQLPPPPATGPHRA